MFLNHTDEQKSKIIDFLLKNPESLKGSLDDFLKFSTVLFFKTRDGKTHKPNLSQIEYLFDLSEIPWAKVLSENKSPTYFDNSVFVNIRNNLSFFQIIKAEDFASEFLVTNRSLKRELYKHALSYYYIGSKKYKVFDFIAFEAAKMIILKYPEIDQQKLISLTSQDSTVLMYNYHALKNLFAFVAKYSLDMSEKSCLDALLKNEGSRWSEKVTDAVVKIMSLENLSDAQLSDLRVLFKTTDRMSDLWQKVHEFYFFITKDKEVPFQQDQKKLQGKKIVLSKELDAQYTIHIPTTSYELWKAGSLLRNCLGDGSYEVKIREGKTNVLFLMRNNKIVFCVEYLHKNIIQFKGFANAHAEIHNKKLEALLPKEPLFFRLKQKLFPNTTLLRPILLLLQIAMVITKILFVIVVFKYVFN